ncbi:MAG: 4-hydroxy-tetrahydrodipicolinate reductase [Ruminococcaceae bacterium]|nr:4-hydroxy-tetrahydrodipicolinate reductase [Oscillospiraceae bacterium]
MNVILNGANGRMGKEVIAAIKKDGDLNIICEVDKSFEVSTAVQMPLFPAYDIGADVIIDFSHHSAIDEVAEYAEKFNVAVVLCTTGQTDEEIEKVKKLANKVPVFFSANMSMGVALLCELAKKSAVVLPDADIEIIEKHHSAKLDAPSGTALMLANAIKSVREKLTLMLGRSGRREREKNEIGIHAVRAGNIVGEHEIILATKNEIITLSHSAMSRSVFADGAIAAAKWICGKAAGLYAMQDMIK